MNYVRKNLIRYSQGATLVEFALLAPIFFVMVFTIFEVSWLIYVKQSFSAAAREGARMVAVQEATTTQAEDFIRDYVAGLSINISQLDPQVDDPDPTCNAPPTQITVNISAPAESVSLFGTVFEILGQSIDIESRVVMRKECTT